MTPDEFAARWPRLWHMAHRDAWPSIESHGLLSTSALLDLFEVNGADRQAIEEHRRPESILIEHPIHGRAVIRDNKPMSDVLLRRCLDPDMDLRDWYRTLNGRVFFWVPRRRLEVMLSAGAYRGKHHLVLEVDTASLLERHIDEVSLCATNSGATHPGALVPRGRDTFRRFGDYPWDERRNHSEPVAELAVDYSVSDIGDLVVARHKERRE